MVRNRVSLGEKQEWLREKNSTNSSSSTATPFFERHYSVAEVASKWNYSQDVVRNIFQDEPGVLVLGNEGSHKRRYTTLRIPESVLERVHRRLSKV
jgi:hypothetical protein